MKKKNYVGILSKTALTNKNKARHECNACDKIFRESQDIERHIEAKHEEKNFVYCDQNFTGDQALVKTPHGVCGPGNKIC